MNRITPLLPKKSVGYSQIPKESGILCDYLHPTKGRHTDELHRFTILEDTPNTKGRVSVEFQTMEHTLPFFIQSKTEPLK